MAHPTCMCGARMTSNRMSVTRMIGGRTVTVGNVPALICPTCGSIMYQASTVRTMDALIRQNPHSEALSYPQFGGSQASVMTRLGASDSTFSENPGEIVRRYDVARLESLLINP